MEACRADRIAGCCNTVRLTGGIVGDELRYSWFGHPSGGQSHGTNEVLVRSEGAADIVTSGDF